MAALQPQRPSASLKTYSRRVNNNPDPPPPTSKRTIQETDLIVEQPFLPKKLKRDSIQNYFKPLPTPEPSSDSLEPSPPSSPSSQTSRNPTPHSRSLQRPKRRLNARPNLAPISKMSDSGENQLFDFDDEERDNTPYLTKSSASSSSESLKSHVLFNPTSRGPYQPSARTATPHSSILRTRVHSQLHSNTFDQSDSASASTSENSLSGASIQSHDSTNPADPSVSRSATGSTRKHSLLSATIQSQNNPAGPSASRSASDSTRQHSLSGATNRIQNNPVGLSASRSATGSARRHSLLGATLQSHPQAGASVSGSATIHTQNVSVGATTPSQAYSNVAGASGSQSVMTSQTASGPSAPVNRRKVHFGDTASSAINTATAPINITKKLDGKIGVGQYQAIIDLGQSTSNKCQECGMPYTLTLKADVDAHTKYHRQFLGGAVPKINSGNMSVFEEYRDPVIGPGYNTFVNARSSAEKHQIQVYDRAAGAAVRAKAEDMYRASFQHFSGDEISSKELWSEIPDPHHPSSTNFIPRYKLYIYTIGVELVGLLLAERVSSAVPYSGEDALSPSKPVPVRLAIDRIWVRRDRQREGIATKLVDLARETAINGISLSKSDLAWSFPTSQGTRFGKRYVDGEVEGGWFLVVE